MNSPRARRRIRMVTERSARVRGQFSDEGDGLGRPGAEHANLEVVAGHAGHVGLAPHVPAVEDASQPLRIREEGVGFVQEEARPVVVRHSKDGRRRDVGRGERPGHQRAQQGKGRALAAPFVGAREG